MCIAGPDLAPVDEPAAVGLCRARRGGEHVRARIRLAEADPALGADLAAEFARKRPLAAIRREGARLDLLAQKGANLFSQFLGRRWQFDRIKAETVAHRRLTILQ